MTLSELKARLTEAAVLYSYWGFAVGCIWGMFALNRWLTLQEQSMLPHCTMSAALTCAGYLGMKHLPGAGRPWMPSDFKDRQAPN